MTMEIVDFPITNGDFPWLFVSLPGRVTLLATYSTLASEASDLSVG